MAWKEAEEVEEVEGFTFTAVLHHVRAGHSTLKRLTSSTCLYTWPATSGPYKEPQTSPGMVMLQVSGHACM